MIFARRSLQANFGWMLVANTVYAGCNWATLAVLAKLSDPARVGRYALAVAVATPVIMLANLNLRSVLATDVRGQYAFRDYLAVRLATVTIGLLIVIGLSSRSSAAQSNETGGLIAVVGLALAAECVGDTFYGLMQREERMERIALSLASKGVLAIAAVTLLLRSTGSILFAVSGVAAARLLVLILYDARYGVRDCLRDERAAGEEPTPGSWRIRRQIFATALPLGIVLTLISLTTNIPRYFIERQAGEWQLGIFAALASLISFGNMIVNALGQAATPRLARQYAAGDRPAFTRTLLRLLLVALLFGAVGLALAATLGEELLRLLFKAEYGSYAGLLQLMMLFALIGYAAMLLGYALTAVRFFKSQVPLHLAVTVGAAVAAACLIPRYGITGAALAIGITSSIHLIGEVIILLTAWSNPAVASSEAANLPGGTVSLVTER